MTQGEYPYPPDEFDAVDPSAGPRGAHRRPRSRWATAWPYLLALVVSALLAYVVIGLVWDGRTAPAAAPQGAPAAVATPSPEPEPEASPDDLTPPAEAPPVDAPPVDAPPAPEEPAVAPDLTVPVLVLNSTSVPGLAADVAGRLGDAGWTSVSARNFAGALPGSTVRYPTADLEASARAVADELGIASVELGGSDGPARVEVVLEADFADVPD